MSIKSLVRVFWVGVRGGGGCRGGKEDLKPKVAARNGKNSISTILRGKERTVNSLTYSPIF